MAKTMDITISLYLLPFYLLLFSHTCGWIHATDDITLQNPCTVGLSTPFTFELETDYAPRETTWELTDYFSETVYEMNGPYNESWTIHNETYCITTDGCFLFRIEDNYGEFDGYYKLYWDGKQIKKGGDFGKRDVVIFGTACPTSAPSTTPPISLTESPTALLGTEPSDMDPLDGTSGGDGDDGDGGVGLGVIVGVSVGLGAALLSGGLAYLCFRGKDEKNLDSGAKRPPRDIFIE